MKKTLVKKDWVVYLWIVCKDQSEVLRTNRQFAKPRWRIQGANKETIALFDLDSNLTKNTQKLIWLSNKNH